MERFVLILSGMITGFLAAYICKVPVYSPAKDGKGSDINAKGWVAVALCVVDIHYAAPHGFMEVAITSIVTLIGFVLSFYIIYGIMSLLKVSGEDTEDRRTKAFWVNAAISTVLAFLVYS